MVENIWSEGFGEMTKSEGFVPADGREGGVVGQKDGEWGHYTLDAKWRGGLASREEAERAYDSHVLVEDFPAEAAGAKAERQAAQAAG